MIDKILWLRKAVLKFTEDTHEREDKDECDSAVPYNHSKTKTISTSEDSKFQGGLSFTLHRANGGYVVSTGYYDITSDRHTQNLHVVGDNEEIGDAISKIITLEGLRQR